MYVFIFWAMLVYSFCVMSPVVMLSLGPEGFVQIMYSTSVVSVLLIFRVAVVSSSRNEFIFTVMPLMVTLSGSFWLISTYSLTWVLA